MAIAPGPRRWPIVAPLISVLIAFGLWSGYWWWGSSAAQRQVAAARAELTRQGLAIACGSESHGGFPFRFSITCTGPDMAGADGWRSSTSEIEVLAQAWNPGHLIFLIAGPLRLARPDGQIWTISHTPAVASLVVGRVGAQASLLAEQVRASGPAGETLAAGRLNLHVRLPEARFTEGTATSAVADFAVFASALDFSRPGDVPLRVESIEAEATLTALPLALPGRLADFLRATAAAGAELRLTRFVASAEAVDVDASGNVGLDAAGLPSGRIAMRFNDVKLLFSRLAERGLLAPQAADGAAVLVGLLTTAGAAVGKSGPIDLVFRDGSIFWGPFRLASHGPLF